MKNIGTLDLLENLGKIRDGLLLLISAIYALGYIVWAIFAWRNNLGFMPVLQSQYFVAGCPIFIFIVLTYFVIRLLHRITFKWWPKFFYNLSFMSQKLTHLAVNLLELAFAIVLIYSSMKKAQLSIQVVFALCSIFIILTIVTPLPPEVNKITTKHLRRITLGTKVMNAYILPLLFFIYLTQIFVNTYFMKIPQEFGGAKPRIAVLDLVKSKLSAPTLKEIVDTSNVQLNSEILPSKQVNIYFNGGNYLLIGKFDTTAYKGVLEIPRDAIISIHWLSNIDDSDKTFVNKD